jgi:hypothetical protein
MSVGPDAPAGIPLANGEIMTVTHNAGKRALAVIVLDQLGGVIDNSQAIVTTNGLNSFSIQNDSGGPLAIRVLVFFEIFSPGFAGNIPEGDSRIVIA